MATPDLIARQFQREIEAKQEAERRLAERTNAAEERNYASSTVYGNAFIKQALNPIADEISDKMARITLGWTQQNAAAVAHLKTADPYVLALLTAKGCLDAVCHGTGLRGDRSRIPYIAVTTFIGRLVKDQLMLDEFAAACPEAFNRTVQHAHKGYSYKVAKYRKAMSRVNHESSVWTGRINHLVGAWLLDRLAAATGWVEVFPWFMGTIKGGGARTVNCVRLSAAFMAAKDVILDQAQRLAVCRWPMLCEPNDWADDRKGGYLTAELRRSDRLIRSKRPLPSLVLKGTPALQMLNTLQKVPYRINPFILAIANNCAEMKRTVGKFRAEDVTPPPPKPDWDTASDEEKVAYRKARTEIEDFNASLEQRNYRTTETLWVANKYAEDVFWIPWSFDFRGRVYPLVTSLSPQGTDVDKSLIYFAEEGPVDEWWLSFQVATTRGLDKASMDDRIEWVKNNHDLITVVATEPMSNLSLWAEAEEPWCFLAACREYWECVITKQKSTSGLPIGIDATCSGLQHLSALTYDRGAAKMVNVVPTEKPTDAYAIVAEAAKAYLPPKYHPLMTRKVTKRTVMTTPYGVTQDSARGYIREELPKTFEDGEPLELSKVVKAVFREAIPSVIPGPIKAMRFIQQAAVEAIKDGRDYLTWRTPSGFTVIQDDRQTEVIKVETRLLGTRIQSKIAKDTSSLSPSPNQAKKGSAPNLVHSLDASLLHLVFSQWDRPFTVIHDCVLGRSCDMRDLSREIRDKFVEIYRQPILKDWAEQIGVAFDDSIMVNTLDINDVQDSLYFFS
jgi:DNA-directed RNA polymerase